MLHAVVALPGCVNCNPDLQAAILDDRFGYRMVTIALPLLIGSALVATGLPRRSRRSMWPRPAPACAR